MAALGVRVELKREDGGAGRKNKEKGPHRLVRAFGVSVGFESETRATLHLLVCSFVFLTRVATNLNANSSHKQIMFQLHYDKLLP
jgi:rRNA maturation protein Rpf1